ncbi:hypothetical protein JTB14_008206 [Gonioctena quinquepunctata]|nr:hypothetical protein JTB14_008206 [Gonioctena quinquepunctata]
MYKLNFQRHIFFEKRRVSTGPSGESTKRQHLNTGTRCINRALLRVREELEREEAINIAASSLISRWDWWKKGRDDSTHVVWFDGLIRPLYTGLNVFGEETREQIMQIRNG